MINVELAVGAPDQLINEFGGSKGNMGFDQIKDRITSRLNTR